MERCRLEGQNFQPLKDVKRLEEEDYYLFSDAKYSFLRVSESGYCQREIKICEEVLLL